MSLTSDPSDPDLKEIEESGMQKKYLVLSEEERAKGFVRPLRRSYRHFGPPPPMYPLRELTPEEQERWADYDYWRFEKYPEGAGAKGKYWTKKALDAVNNGCGQITKMGLALCETYARNPKFYGGTFCVGCHQHFPVQEFLWEEDGAVVGS